MDSSITCWGWRVRFPISPETFRNGSILTSFGIEYHSVCHKIYVYKKVNWKCSFQLITVKVFIEHNWETGFSQLGRNARQIGRCNERSSYMLIDNDCAWWTVGIFWLFNLLWDHKQHCVFCSDVSVHIESFSRILWIYFSFFYNYLWFD